MNEILNVAGKEIVRREIMELCREAEPYGAGTPVLKAALRKTGHDLTDQELMRQVDFYYILVRYFNDNKLNGKKFILFYFLPL